MHTIQEQIRAALMAEVREHQRLLLRKLLFLIDALDHSIKHLELEIKQHHTNLRAKREHPSDRHTLSEALGFISLNAIDMSSFEEQVKQCEKINGVNCHVLHVLIAEVGTDLQCFPDAEHRSLMGGSLSRTEGKCWQTTQRTGKTRQSICVDTSQYKLLMEFVDRTPIWGNSIVTGKTTREQTSYVGGRTQYLCNLLSDDENSREVFHGVWIIGKSSSSWSGVWSAWVIR